MRWNWLIRMIWSWRSSARRVPASGSARLVIRWFDNGKVVKVRGSLQEITERKRAEEVLRATLEEKTALLKEVHHRVKNNLQIVSSLLNLQARQVKNPAALEPLRDTQGRIRSMALLHETLYREDSVARVNCAVYFGHLCAHLCRSFGHMAEQVRVIADVAPVELGIDVAIPCGLIVNELVTELRLNMPFQTGAEVKLRSDSRCTTTTGLCCRLRITEPVYRPIWITSKAGRWAHNW